MQAAKLDYILKTDACQGAFRVNGATLSPLSTVTTSVEQGAYRTRNLWASLVPIVSDVGLMVGTRGPNQSIAAANGGLIVESRKPMNLGLLKSALTDQDRVGPGTPRSVTPDLDPGQIALWNLSEWIATVEAPRCLRVHLGDDALTLVAQRGCFRPAAGLTVRALSDAITSAAKANCRVELSYAPLPEELGTCDLNPLTLLGADLSTSGEWCLTSGGAPVSVPKTATFATMRDLSVLAQTLNDWRQGHPFELAVIRNGHSKEIIASSDAEGDIKVTPPALKRPCSLDHQNEPAND